MPGGLETCTVQAGCPQFDIAVAPSPPELVSDVPPGVVGALNVRHGERFVPGLGVMLNPVDRFQVGQDLRLMLFDGRHVLLRQDSLRTPVAQPVAVVPEDDTSTPEPLNQILNTHNSSPDSSITAHDIPAISASYVRSTAASPAICANERGWADMCDRSSCVGPRSFPASAHTEQRVSVYSASRAGPSG